MGRITNFPDRTERIRMIERIKDTMGFDGRLADHANRRIRTATGRDLDAAMMAGWVRERVNRRFVPRLADDVEDMG